MEEILRAVEAAWWDRLPLEEALKLVADCWDILYGEVHEG